MEEFNIDLNSIRLDESGFYCTNSLKGILTVNGVTSVAQFLHFADNYTGKLYGEVKGLARIIRCKYLDIDPEIDENDKTVLSTQAPYQTRSDLTEEGIEHMRRMLGLSDRAAKAICKKYRTPADFFRAFRNDETSVLLRDATNLVRQEITSKVRVVIEYNDKKAARTRGFQKLSAEDARTILDTLRSLYTKKQEIDGYIQNALNESMAIEEQIGKLFATLEAINANYRRTKQQ